MKYQFIADHQKEFEITVMCRVLQVSRSGYYAWRDRPTSAREMANQALSKRIEKIWQENRKTYGSPRVWAELARQEVRCSRKRVARLMRLGQMVGRTRRKSQPITTVSADNDRIAPNLLNREFEADRPNEKWTSDITYIPTAEGWLYLAVVLDLYSRQIVGWAMADNLERQLVITALHMAIKVRQPPPGLLHHSDRGSQYASDDYRTVLSQAQMQVSMSRKGNCWDNAPTESFFSTLKIELVYQEQYQTRAAAKTSVFEYIEVFYNRVRSHSALQYQSPVNYENSTLID